jgi:TRAP-type C4-dicarboxylate transport system substrate-binding protein
VIRSKKSGMTAGLAISSSLVLLAGCSGAIGDEDGRGSGEGFEFGAPQSEVDSAIEELEPVTLVYQASAPSQDATAAVTAAAFTEAVEERSGGKITLDVVWGQAIAGYPELDDALADGRVDIAYHLPIYDPAAYPGVDAYNKLTQYSSPAPLTGEAVSQAMMSEAAWNNEKVLSDYSEKGLTALSPLLSSGDYWIACTEPGSTMSDWNGRQIRVAATAQSEIASSIGASPVSMEYGETFEALQRGTIDCTFLQAQVAASTGLLEVAPHISVLSEGRMTGGANAAHVAGSGFTDLPLPYQQIIFDAEIDQFHGQLATTMDSALQAVNDARAAGGSFTPIDSEAEEKISETQERLVDELIAEGRVDKDIREQLEQSAEKWTEIVEELGYVDGGDLTDLDQWYEVGGVDFRPLGQRVVEEAALSRRPQ